MKVALRALLRRVLPGPVRRLVGAGLRRLPQPKYATMSRRQIFQTIYRRGAWGRGAARYYSGPGSDDAFAVPYAAAVKALQARFAIRTVVDLGCGDFRVAGHFADAFEHYTGVDIVPELVAHNQRQYGGARVSFACVDICAEPLPEAELCLVRQVLQHLTNADIAELLPKLARFQYVLVTEHLPKSPSPPNLDKPPGPGVRVPLGSGVVLHEAPFGWPRGEEVTSEPLPTAMWQGGERLVTTLYKMAPAAQG